MDKNFKNIIYIILLLFLFGCSTTKRLPEGEVLYIGVKDIQMIEPDNEKVSTELESQVTSAVSAAPNNAFFGSAKLRIPFPMGLWIYNAFKTDKEKGFKRWIFNRFAAEPVLLSTVDPKMRAKIAETLMDDYGYFNGTVDYTIIPDKKNSKKAKISYVIDYHQPFRYKSVQTMETDIPADSVIQSIQKYSLIKEGDIFNVNKLEAERTRISDTLRNQGYYYYRPDFISYEADSTIGNNEISLRILPRNDLPRPVLQPWKIGDIDVVLHNTSGLPSNDTLKFRTLNIAYRNKLKTRKNVLYNRITFKPGMMYSPLMEETTMLNLNRLNSYKYTEVKFVPQDTLPGIDSLKVMIDATYDLPYDAELELNITTKSNEQTGPGAIFGVIKRNVFNGGEVLNTEFTASYEWLTGKGARNGSGKNLIDSYEFGVSTSLTIPRLLLPKLVTHDRRYPSSTIFRLNADILNRAGFFQLMNIGGSAKYDFYTSPTSTHSFTAFSLKYNSLLSTTHAFDTVMNDNRALKLSFEDQFIPSMGYSYTYDDASISSRRNHVWFQFTLTEAGNLLYYAMDLLGNKQGNNKKLLGQDFSQFVKSTAEVRYYYMLTKKQMLASRFMIGAAKAYKNSSVIPYSESFFIGGANSIRAFSARTIGPGSYHPATDALYSYLDQTGNFKLEANLEYRFPLVSSLYGALFLDAGNVWLLQKDSSKPGGEINFRDFGNDIALGTGFGLRFDITFLVIRFDIGIPLHKPYETDRSGYYNVKDFWTNLSYHLAIGYPF